MATKLGLGSNKMFAMGEVRRALRAIPKEDLATVPLSVGAVVVLLDKDPKTLHTARKKRAKMLEAGAKILPLELESIPFAGTPTAATYMALDLVEYLDRKALAPTLHVWEQTLPQSYPNLQLPRSFLGFQSWLARAEVTDLWPFSIQGDGRPMDLIAAILNDTVGDDLRWLTIREFGTLAADTASQAFHDKEKGALTSLPTEPVATELAEKADERDRWKEPGGPL